MRAECPNFREKIIPLETNFDAPDLGLSDPIRYMLNAEVQVSGWCPLKSIADNNNWNTIKSLSLRLSSTLLRP